MAEIKIRTKNSIRMRKYVISILIGLSSFFVQGQPADLEEEESPLLYVIARAHPDSIMLRWAVSTPLMWKLANEHGYQLERFTVLRNGETLAEPEQKDLGTFKPLPMSEWEAVFESSDAASIMAQALYGESFIIETGDELASIVNQSEELTQRFTFSLMAAEQDFQVAVWAGLGYVDKEVKKDEKYLYRITALVPQESELLEPAGVFISPSESEELPRPKDLAAVFGNESVMLSWNYLLLSDVYNAYYIEKSEDGGKHYQRLNEKPFTNLFSEDSESDRFFYADSLNANGFVTHYRVLGISPFGEVGPPSDPVSGQGHISIENPPQITYHDLLDNEMLEMAWSFKEEEQEALASFELSEALEDKGTYQTVMSLTPERRTLTYKQELGTAYYKIVAVGKDGDRFASQAILSQKVDSIPPTPPVELVGEIDSMGIVTLSWKPNEEDDLQGYRVFRSNTLKEEPSQITTALISESQFVDSVSMKMSNSKVYYYLVATDKRFNNSKLSEALELIKPDVIPPIPPLIQNYKIEESEVLLSWVRSRDDDVVSHVLYRKEKGTESWEEVADLQFDTIQIYADVEVPVGKTIEYKLVAKDVGDLTGESPVLMLKIPDIGLKPPVRNFTPYVDRNNRYIELSWMYNQPDVEKYILYRAVGEDRLSLFRELYEPEKRMVDDRGLKPNTTYRYVIQAVFGNGTFSEPKELIVEY